MFSNTKSTPIVLSSLLALISLLLCMQHGWAQTPAVGGNGPHIVVDPTTLDFGSPVVGQSVTKTLTVRNTGTAPLFIIFDLGLPAPPLQRGPRGGGRIQDTAE